MRVTSERWLPAIFDTHQMVSEVQLVGGDLLPLIDGSVTLDAKAATRGGCDLIFPGDVGSGLVPSDPNDPLSPYGQELQVRRGIRYGPGDEELVSLGIFGIQESEINPDDSSIRVTGLDKSQKVIDASFEETKSIAGGSDFLDALLNVVQEALPAVEYDFVQRTATTPTLLAEEGDDRWQFALDMAASIGLELYFDGDGVMLLRVIPEVGSSGPDIYLVEGQGGLEVKPPSLLDASKTLSRTDSHNRWIVTGDNPDNGGVPPRAVVTDDRDTSPTNYFGRFGKKPKFYSSTFIATDAQAMDAAQGLKSKEMGIAQSVNFGSLVNPALEPDDIARITRTLEDGFPVIDEDHIIDQLVIPLKQDGKMTGQTRAAQVLA